MRRYWSWRERKTANSDGEDFRSCQTSGTSDTHTYTHTLNFSCHVVTRRQFIHSRLPAVVSVIRCCPRHIIDDIDEQRFHRQRWRKTIYISLYKIRLLEDQFTGTLQHPKWSELRGGREVSRWRQKGLYPAPRPRWRADGYSISVFLYK